MIDHVVRALTEAMSFRSKLNRDTTGERAAAVPSFTSPKIRHLLNNLGSASGIHYLEVGVHKGGTFVATNYGNELASSTAVDNWSEFPQGGESRRLFLDYTASLLKPGSFRFLEMDCFDMGPEHVPAPVNLYLYDGNHSADAQERALTHFYPLLADEFVLLVDDYDWSEVQKGTFAGLGKLMDQGARLVYSKQLLGSDGWWNGFYVAVVKKP